MIRIVLVLTGAALLLTAGCDKLGGEPDFYPTSVGSTWRHTIAATLVELDGDTVWSAVSRSEVVGKATLAAGGEAAVVVTLDSMRMRIPHDTIMVYSDTSWVQKKDNRVLMFESVDETSPDTTLVLPLEANKTWLVSAEGGGETRAKVIGKQDVTVPAGTFKDSWMVELASTDAGPDTMRVHWYLAGDVGLIRMHYLIETEPYRTEFENRLTNYNIK